MKFLLEHYLWGLSALFGGFVLLWLGLELIARLTDKDRRYEK